MEEKKKRSPARVKKEVLPADETQELTVKDTFQSVAAQENSADAVIGAQDVPMQNVEAAAIAVSGAAEFAAADGRLPEGEPDPELAPDMPRELSPARMIAKRFFRSKLSVFGLITLVVLFLFSFLGPVIFNRWGETEVDQSPGQITYLSTEFTYTAPDGSTATGYEVIISQYTQNIYAPPSSDHILGTDDQGMDVFTRLMYGGRVSLMLGFIVIILETIIGVLLGGLAGYFGKWVDQLIMRIVDIFNCLPTLPILLIASTLLDSWGIPSSVRIYYLMVILTIFGWSGTARLVRGQILQLREQEYMTAAEAMGLPTWRKIFKHLIPNVMPQLIVSMTLGLGSVIIMEASLSYLGLGVPLPFAAWGTMISGAKKPEILSNYFNMWGPPGICIILAVLAFNFIGDGLRDAFDPKMKR